jgi:hypothetical protein
MSKVDDHIAAWERITELKHSVRIGELDIRFSVDRRGKLRISTETKTLGVGKEIKEDVVLPRDAVTQLFDWIADVYGLKTPI